MSKFAYENEGELELADCQCEFCKYFNAGARSDLCPKESITQIINNEIWCPMLKTDSIFDD